MTNAKKTELLKEAFSLIERANTLLDKCYLAHCKAAGVSPQ
jgi:hypothetical protein